MSDSFTPSAAGVAAVAAAVAAPAPAAAATTLNEALEQLAAGVAAALNAQQVQINAMMAKIDDLAASAASPSMIRFDGTQDLTASQQAQALQNLGLTGSEFFVAEDLVSRFHDMLEHKDLKNAIEAAFGADSAPAASAS